RIDDVIACVVRDRVRRTRLLAGIAADTDLRIDEMLAQHFDRRVGSAHVMFPMMRQLKRTYSKSVGWFLIPRAGGAIQLAKRPGSATRPISDATNARSASEGNQCRCRGVQSSSLTTLPSGSMRAADSGPILRLNALCGAFSR